MDKVQEIIEFIRNVEMSQIIDLIIAIVTIIIFVIISPLFSYGLVKVFFRHREKEEIKSGNIYKALKLFFVFSGVYIATKIVDLEQFQNEFIDKCFIIIIIWTVARIISGVFESRGLLIDKLTKGESNKKNAFFTSVVGIIVKVVLYVLALYLTLKEFGYDIGGLATGIGLTGAVVALAAQDFLKQIISGLSIFIDKPFEVGDWIEVKEISGTVEDITIKSTKIRTIEDTVVTVPNDLITSSNVINWDKISKRVYKANLRLGLETEETVIEKVINRIKFILKYNDDVITKSINVTLNEIKDDGINIAIYLETTVTDFWKYKDFCNKINLTLLNILETQGVNLSYPGRNVFINDKVESKKSKKVDKNKKYVKPTKITK